MCELAKFCGQNLKMLYSTVLYCTVAYWISSIVNTLTSTLLELLQLFSPFLLYCTVLYPIELNTNTGVSYWIGNECSFLNFSLVEIIQFTLLRFVLNWISTIVNTIDYQPGILFSPTVSITVRKSYNTILHSILLCTVLYSIVVYCSVL